MKLSRLQNRNKLLRSHSNILPLCQLLIDTTSTLGLLYLLTLLKTGTVSIQYSILMVLSVLIMHIVYQYTGQYRQNHSIARSLFKRFKAWLYVIGILLSIAFITKAMGFYSREVLSIWAVTAFIAQSINYLIFTKFTTTARKKSQKKHNTLVIGVSHTSRRLIESIEKNIWLEQSIVGYVNNDEAIAPQSVPYLGDLTELNQVIERYSIKSVYIVFPSHQLDQLESIYLQLMLKDVTLHWVPDISALNLINHHVKEISGLPIITLSESPLEGGKLIYKTIFDVILTSIILIILSPLLLITALLIKITSSGPILFCQERHGWNNKIFKIYKFRSMKVHKEKAGIITQATLIDNRVTPIGRFIRRTSIDELPQLFNVLKGDMSLVGPRPHAVAHNELFEDQIDDYLARHKIKPGITGLAQITGFRGETDTLDKMQGRVQQDISYINNWSIALDIEILFKTGYALVSDTAY